MLEPYEVKVSRTVLRGLGGGNISRLPDIGTSLRSKVIMEENRSATHGKIN